MYVKSKPHIKTFFMDHKTYLSLLCTGASPFQLVKIVVNSIIFIMEHIVRVATMSVFGYSDRRFKPRLHQYVVSLSRTLNPHYSS